MRHIAKAAEHRAIADDQRIWLRSLILLRWFAIAGQIIALATGYVWFMIDLPLAPCLAAVSASVLVNLSASLIAAPNHRLSPYEALASLTFDLAQLGLLLFVTGGLTNPFALLVLAPVTISASALGLRPTLILGTAAILMVTFLAFFSVPIHLEDGSLLEVPPLFTFGFWLAIVVGLLFLGIYNGRIARDARSTSDALLATQMALAREQKLTDLGGVVAAAAHELGTPLATIKLVSSEMMSELKDRPDLLEDAGLIREQADRCRDILRSMGRAGKDDLQLRQAPVSTVVREAAEPHMARGKEVFIGLFPDEGDDLPEPVIRRSPEIIHGLRNLVQNAVDFAHARVWVDCEWDEHSLTIRVVDDGEGYPQHVLSRIGSPFVRARRPGQQDNQRPEYEGMGLGLFIAKTLLERTGAQLTFANASDPFETEGLRPDRCGALVELVWDNSDILAPHGATGAPNQLIHT